MYAAPDISGIYVSLKRERRKTEADGRAIALSASVGLQTSDESPSLLTEQEIQPLILTQLIHFPHSLIVGCDPFILSLRNRKTQENKLPPSDQWRVIAESSRAAVPPLVLRPTDAPISSLLSYYEEHEKKWR